MWESAFPGSVSSLIVGVATFLLGEVGAKGKLGPWLLCQLACIFPVPFLWSAGCPHQDGRERLWGRGTGALHLRPFPARSLLS